MSNSPSNDPQSSIPTGGNPLTREQVWEMVAAEFARIQSNLVGSLLLETAAIDGLEKKKFEMRALIKEQCPDIVAAPEDLDALQKAVSSDQPKPTEGFFVPLTPEFVERQRNELCGQMMTCVIERIRKLLAGNTSVSDQHEAEIAERKKAIPREEIIAIYIRHGKSIGYDVQGDNLMRVSIEKGYASARGAEIRGILDAVEQEWQKVRADLPETCSADQAVSLVRGMYFEQLRHLVNLKKIDSELARCCGTNLKAQCDRTVNDIDAWFAAQQRQKAGESVEFVPVTMPKWQLQKMWEEAEKDTDSREFDSALKHLSTEEFIQIVRIADLRTKAIQELFQEADIYLTEKDCVALVGRYVEMAGENSSKDREINAPFAEQAVLTIENVHRESVRRIREWFAERKVSTNKEHAETEPVKMSKQVFMDIRKDAVEKYPSIDKTRQLKGMAPHLRTQIQQSVLADQQLERTIPTQFTAQQFSELFLRMKKSQFANLLPWKTHDERRHKQMFRVVELRHVYIEGQVHAWFAAQKPAAVETASIKMTLAEFKRIAEKAIDDNLLSPADRDRVQAKLNAMPPDLQRRYEAAQANAVAFQNQLPDSLDERAINAFRKRSQEYISQIYSVWKSYDGEIYRLLLQEHEATYTQLDQDTRAWFAERETSGGSFTKGEELTPGTFHGVTRKQESGNTPTLEKTLPKEPNILTRNALREIFADAWRRTGQETAAHHFPNDRELLKKMDESIPETIREIFNALCPEQVSHLQQLEPVGKALLGPIATERAAHPDKTVISFREPAWRGFIARVAQCMGDAGDSDDLWNLPEVVTREWVLQGLLAANRSAANGVQDIMTKGYEDKLRSMIMQLCPATVSHSFHLDNLVYWLLGQIDGIDSMVTPETSVTSMTPSQRERNRSLFELSLQRIYRALSEKGTVLSPLQGPILDGIPGWPIVRLEIPTSDKEHVEWAQATIHTNLMRNLEEGMKTFIQKNRDAVAERYPRLRKAFDGFLHIFGPRLAEFMQKHCPDPISSQSAMYGIDGFCEEGLYGLGFWTVEADLAVNNPLYRSLQQRLEVMLDKSIAPFSNAMMQRLEQTLQEQEGSVKDLALIREPWLPKPPQAEESFPAEQCWTNILDRAFVSRAKSLVAHCVHAGIVFPSERRAGEARAMLRHLFQNLRKHCNKAIAEACHGQALGPDATTLCDLVTTAIMNMPIPDACPRPLSDAFAITVQQHLLDGFSYATMPLLAEDQQTVRDPSASWDRELDALFTSREALPPTEARELERAVEPIKIAFIAGMLRNMISAVERRPVGASEDQNTYAVSSRHFDAAWIPMIQDAVSGVVDAYIAQQPVRAPTIRAFLEQNLNSVRQRTLFTRVSSAAEARLKSLKENAPAEPILAAMRRMIEPISLDALDEAPIDMMKMTAGELLGPRDAVLLPQERMLLEQLCRNAFDLDGDVPEQTNRLVPALESLALECIRSYHAGFPCRSSTDFLPHIASIVDALRAARDTAAQARAEESRAEELPPHIAELDRLAEDNQLWILGWPERRTKKDEELWGFLQQVLHWQEIATIFLRQFRNMGEGITRYEEAKRAADSVAIVRQKGIVCITQERQIAGGRKRNASIAIAKGKVRAFLDWRLERERALHASEHTGSDPLHHEADESLVALQQLAREMHILTMETLAVPGSERELLELKRNRAQEQQRHDTAKHECADANELLEPMSQWRAHAGAAGSSLLCSIAEERRKCAQERSDAAIALQNARQAVETAQQELHARAGNRDAHYVAQLCTNLAEAQQRLEGLERYTGPASDAKENLLVRWERAIRSFLIEISAADVEHATEGASSEIVAWEILHTSAKEFISRAEEWQLYNEVKQVAESVVQQSQIHLERMNAELLVRASQQGEDERPSGRLAELRNILDAAKKALQKYVPSPKK